MKNVKETIGSMIDVLKNMRKINSTNNWMRMGEGENFSPLS